MDAHAEGLANLLVHFQNFLQNEEDRTIWCCNCHATEEIVELMGLRKMLPKFVSYFETGTIFGLQTYFAIFLSQISFTI